MIEPDIEKVERALRRVLDATDPGASKQVRLELRPGVAERLAPLEAWA